MADTTRRLYIEILARESASAEFKKVQEALKGVGLDAKMVAANARVASEGLSRVQVTLGAMAKGAQAAGGALRSALGGIVPVAGSLIGVFSALARVVSQGGFFQQLAEKAAITAQVFGGTEEGARGFFASMASGAEKLHGVVAALIAGGLILKAFGVDMSAVAATIARVVPGMGALTAAAGGLFTALRQSGLGTQVLVAGLSAAAIVAGKVVEAIGRRLIDATRGWLNAAVEAERNTVSLGIAIASYEQATGVAIGSTGTWSGFIRQLSADTGIANSEIERSTVVLLRQAQQLRLSAADTQALLKVAADLSVVYQRDFGDTLTAVTSALQGQGRQLKLLGVNLTDAAVAAHQLGDSTGRVFQQMNPAQQALLRFRELLSTTSGISGKAAEIIGGTLAGAFARARIANSLLNEQLGQGSARVFGPLAQLYAGLAARLATLPPALFDVVGATTAFAGIAAVVSGKLLTWGAAVATLTTGLVALDTALGGAVVLPFLASIGAAVAAFSLWAAAIGAVGFVLVDLVQRTRAFLAETGVLGSALAALGSAFGKVGDGARAFGSILRSLVPDGPITALRKINDALFSVVSAAYAAAAGWKAFRAEVQERLGIGDVQKLREEAERLKGISEAASRQTAAGRPTTSGASLQEELAALRAAGGARERSEESERRLVDLQRQKIDAALREAELLGNASEARRLNEKLARLELSADLQGDNAGVARVVLAQRYTAARRAGYDIAKRDLEQVQQTSLTIARAQAEAAQRGFQQTQQAFARRRASEADLLKAAGDVQRANRSVLALQHEQAVSQEGLAKQHGATAAQLREIHATVVATTSAMAAQQDVAAETARDLAEVTRGLHAAQRGGQLELSEQSADLVRAQLDQMVELASRGEADRADAVAKARELETLLRSNLALRVDIARTALEEASAGRASAEEVARLNTELLKANKALANQETLVGRTTKDVVERLETGVVRVGPFLRESFGQVFDGLISGTLKVKDALKSTVLSFGKRIFDAFLEDKIRFEGKLQVNVLRDLPGLFKKGGDAIAGVWGRLFGQDLPAAAAVGTSQVVSELAKITKAGSALFPNGFAPDATNVLAGIADPKTFADAQRAADLFLTNTVKSGAEAEKLLAAQFQREGDSAIVAFTRAEAGVKNAVRALGGDVSQASASVIQEVASQAKVFDQVTAKVGGLSEAVNQSIQPVADALTQPFAEWVKAADLAGGQVAAATASGATTAAQSFGAIPASATQSFNSCVQAAQIGAQGVGQAATAAQGPWSQFFSFLLSTASSVFGGLVSLASSAISAIGGLLSSLGSSAGGALSSILGGASKLLGGASSGGGNIIGGIIDTAKSVFGVGGIISKGITAVGSIFQGSALAQTASGIFGSDGSISKFFGGIKSAITSSRFGPILSSVGNLVGVIGGGFAAFQGVMTLFAKRATGLQRALGGLQSLAGLSTAFTSLQKLLPSFGRFAVNVASAGSSSLNLGSTNSAGLAQFARGLLTQGGFQQLTSALGNLPRLLGDTLGKIIPQVFKTALSGFVTAVQSAAKFIGQGLVQLGVRGAGALGIQLAAQGGSSALGATGAQTASNASSSILSAGSSVLGYVALAYSVQDAVRGIIDASAALREAYRGDAAADRFEVVAHSMAAIGTAIGTYFGGPGVGALVAAGAKIVTQQLAGALIKAVTAVQQPSREGFTVEDLRRKSERNNTGFFGTNSVSAFVGDPFDLGPSPLNPFADMFRDFFADWFLPNLEILYDKAFADIAQKALPGRVVNRQLGEFLGQGVVGPKRRESLEDFRPARFERDPETGERRQTRAAGTLRSDTRGTAALVSGLIGAGSLNTERVARFTNVLANSLATGKKNAEGIRDELFKIVRVATGNLLVGLHTVNSLFEGGAKLAGQTRKEIDLVSRAYQTLAPTVDIPGIAKAAQRDTGGVNVKEVRQGVRVDLLGDAVRGEIELTKKITRNFGDVFLDVVRRLQDRVKDIDVLGVALRVAQEDVKPKGGFIRELQREVREAVLVSAQAGQIGTEGVKAASKALGDGFLAVVTKLQDKAGPAVDVFALAVAESGDRMRKASKDLASDLKIQMNLLLKGLPQLAPQEAAQVTEFIKTNQRGKARSPRGRRRTRKSAGGFVEGLQTLRAFLEASFLKSQGAPALASIRQAQLQRDASVAGLQGTIDNLPNLGPRKRNEALAQIPQLTQQAIEATEAWGSAVLEIVQNLHDLRLQMEDFSLSTQEEIDGLRGATNTADIYNDALAKNAALFTELAAAGASAGEQLSVVTRTMDLLRAQAAARIQDIQDIADAEKKPLQARLDAIDKELAALDGLAGMADSLSAQVSKIRLSGVTSPFRQVENLQSELNRQKDIFRTTTGDERGAAAQRILELSDEQLRAAAEAFGPASGEFQSLQRELLAGLEPIEKIAREAKNQQVALLKEQSAIQDKIRIADEATAAKIDLVNEELANQLTWYKGVAEGLFTRQANALEAQLALAFPGLTEAQYKALINDPSSAAVLVQTQVRDKLGEIYDLLKGNAGLDDGSGNSTGDGNGGGDGKTGDNKPPGQSKPPGTIGPTRGPDFAVVTDTLRFLGEFKAPWQARKWEWYADLASRAFNIRGPGGANDRFKEGTAHFDWAAKFFHQFGRERGGPVEAGRPYVVGERGPEIVIPKRASVVIDHQRTSAVLRALRNEKVERPTLRLVERVPAAPVSRAPSVSGLFRQAAAVMAAIGLAAGVARTGNAAIRPSLRSAVPVERGIQRAVSGMPIALRPSADHANFKRTLATPLHLRQQVSQIASVVSPPLRALNQGPQAVNLGQQRGNILPRAGDELGRLRGRGVVFPNINDRGVRVGARYDAGVITGRLRQDQLLASVAAPIAAAPRTSGGLLRPLANQQQLGLRHAVTSTLSRQINVVNPQAARANLLRGQEAPVLRAAGVVRPFADVTAAGLTNLRRDATRASNREGHVVVGPVSRQLRAAVRAPLGVGHALTSLRGPRNNPPIPQSNLPPIQAREANVAQNRLRVQVEHDAPIRLGPRSVVGRPGLAVQAGLDLHALTSVRGIVGQTQLPGTLRPQPVLATPAPRSVVRREPLQALQHIGRAPRALAVEGVPFGARGAQAAANVRIHEVRGRAEKTGPPFQAVRLGATRNPYPFLVSTHVDLLRGGNLARQTRASLPHLALGGLTRRDVVTQLHAKEAVLPLSNRSAMADIGNAIARALATAKPRVEPISLRRPAASEPRLQVPAAVAPVSLTPQRQDDEPTVIFNVTFNMTVEKGVPMSRARNFARTAWDEFEARAMQSEKFGALGKRSRVQVR